MPFDALKYAIARLPDGGRLIKDRGYRRIWRIECDGNGYFIKFYPHAGNRWKRLVRRSLAGREAERLGWLAAAGVRAPSVAEVFRNISIERQRGDAIALHAIEPSVPLDEILEQQHQSGRPLAEHRELMFQMLDLLTRLDDAGLGHSDLHLGNFLSSNGELHLLDAHAVHRGDLSKRDLLHLAHSVNRIATTADIVRGWRHLRGLEPAPRGNRLSFCLWRKAIRRSLGENRYFGRLRDVGWHGHYFKRHPAPRTWSLISGHCHDRAEWLFGWGILREQIERDQLRVIKRSRSGDVLSGQLTLGNSTYPVIVKRPRRKFWYRYLLEIIRPTRGRRAWTKAWSLIARDLPSAWPMLLMQRKRFGYIVDEVIVFEKIDGPMLATVDLQSLSPVDRRNLFHRMGHTLRRLEQLGLYHWDAKSVNFIIRDDPVRGPVPMMIDVDGIRKIRMNRSPIDRLLRSMRDHPQYTPADSLALCRGYAPNARLLREGAPTAEAALDEKPPVE